MLKNPGICVLDSGMGWGYNKTKVPGLLMANMCNNFPFVHEMEKRLR
jgi:hypothetical protein